MKRSEKSKNRYKQRQIRLKEIEELNRPRQNREVMGYLVHIETGEIAGKIALYIEEQIFWFNPILPARTGYKKSYYADNRWIKVEGGAEKIASFEQQGLYVEPPKDGMDKIKFMHELY
jgi:hypothetical protein